MYMLVTIIGLEPMFELMAFGVINYSIGIIGKVHILILSLLHYLMHFILHICLFLVTCSPFS